MSLDKPQLSKQGRPAGPDISGREGPWTCPQTGRRPASALPAHPSHREAVRSRASAAAHRGGHRRCRISCRPPGSAGWWPRWCWWCCRWWSSPVGCAARPWRSRWSTTRSSGGWPGCTAPGLAAMLAGRWRALGSWWAITRAVVGAAAGPAGPAALAAPARVVRRLELVQHPRPYVLAAGAGGRGRSGWSSGPTGAAGRCRRADRAPGARSWWGSCTPWCRRAAGATSASGWRPGWWRWSPSPASRWGWRRPPTCWSGWRIGVTIPLLAFRLFTPSEVFPITYRRGRSAHLDVGGARGPGDPPGAGGPARPGRRGGQAVRAGRLGRLHPAAHHRQGRPATAAVRQAVRPQPPARRPLVQARPGAAVRPAGGREAVQHRAAAGPAGGLRAALMQRAGLPSPDPLRVRGAHPRAGVPAGHRVLRRRDRARRGRGRRRRSSTTAWASSASCGTPGWPTATSSRPTCWSATAACC